MTRERTKELLPIMQAFADGKCVEYRKKPEGGWNLLTHGYWSSHYEYRIKPEPRVLYTVESHGRVWTEWDKDKAVEFSNGSLLQFKDDVKITKWIEETDSK